MNLKVMVLVSLVGVATSGCDHLKDAQSTCSVQPPEILSSSRKAAFEAAADLTAFAKAPISANFKTEISNAFNATFQKVPDKVAACAMLNQTYVCIADEERAREYMRFMRDSRQCDK